MVIVTSRHQTIDAPAGRSKVSRALPSDVRKVYDLPLALKKYSGAMPHFSLGAAPAKTMVRKVGDLPHIRGRSPSLLVASRH
jgi:hypothetical protein